MSDRYETGYQKLWGWFGLSRASFLTLPRGMMHEMPDDWQNRMASLLQEWDDHWPNFPNVELSATCRKNGKFTPMPDEFKSYRHTRNEDFAKFRRLESK